MERENNMNIFLTGKSAAGKSSAARYLADNFRYEEAISCTTRPMREGEINGKDYYFLTEAEFAEKEQNNEFIETIMYRNWHYGTLKQEFYREENLIFVIEPVGLRTFRRQNIEGIYFYIDTEDTTRYIRQLLRGDDIQEVARRAISDTACFQDIKEYVDFTVGNDREIEECAHEILECVYKKTNVSNVLNLWR